MRQTAPILAIMFMKLERFYGKQNLSDGAYKTGWDKLSRDIGLNPRTLLDAVPHERSSALNGGSMISEVRASKVEKIARVQYTNNPGVGPVPQKRAVTNRKRLTNSSDSAQTAADHILLFGGISPVAAIPSDHTHVLIRLLQGKEEDNYRNNYRNGQQALAKQLPKNFYARRRAYLLIKLHGEKTCKRANPKCLSCPVKLSCVFFAETRREELD